jgi:prepilin-type N-terminal cleavage/methylation domain-containing protein
MNISAKKEQGFTLVELLVSIAIFVIVMTFSLGAVVSVLDAGRQARALKSVMTNLNFTVEAMSRDIKFGDSYYCGQASSFPPSPRNCTGNPVDSEDAISFVSSENEDIIYRLQGNQIQKSTNGGASFLGVTAPEVNIQDMKFYVFNSHPQSGATDDAQPRVTLLIRGYAGEKPTLQSNFVIQTTLSQRSLDL